MQVVVDKVSSEFNGDVTLFRSLLTDLGSHMQLLARRADDDRAVAERVALVLLVAVDVVALVLRLNSELSAQPEEAFAL